MEIREKIIIRASWISIVGNALLAAVKIILGLISGSMAVVADGIDSASDIATSFITLITARLLSKPPNIKYPYGYEKADTIATKALSFIIFFAGSQLAISTIERITSDEVYVMPGISPFMLPCSLSSLNLPSPSTFKNPGKDANSAMLSANGKNMQNDVLISCSVLVGLIFTFIFKLPILDRITALAVSIWIMKVAVQIFFKTNMELMDGMNDPILYCELFNAVRTVEGAQNPHRVRVRKIGNFHMISMDIEVDPMMSVTDAHNIAQKVEEQIRTTLPNVYDIVVHVEPLGNTREDEKFGLTEMDVKEIEKNQNHRR